MQPKALKVVLAGFVLLVIAGPVWAHHSVSAEFDVNQPIEFTGKVQQVNWLNPHIYTLVTVTEADGSEITYRVEGSAPNSLFRRGWRKDTMAPGQQVTVEGIRAKNPDSMAVGSATITTEEGTRVFSGSAN
jgi:hypothetical protein